MTDKPEAVAWMYSKPGCAEEWFTDPWPELLERGWTETPLYAHPPSQPDAAALVELLVDVFSSPELRIDNRGNAPGHGHQIPGIWDSDNGDRAGTECAWCKKWNAARAALSAWEAQHG